MYLFDGRVQVVLLWGLTEVGVHRKRSPGDLKNRHIPKEPKNTPCNNVTFPENPFPPP